MHFSASHDEQVRETIAAYKQLNYKEEDILSALHHLEEEKYGKSSKLTKLAKKSKRTRSSEGKILATPEFIEICESLGSSITHQANLLEYAKNQAYSSKRTFRLTKLKSGRPSTSKELATPEFIEICESIGMSPTHQANLLEYAPVENTETQKHIETA